MLNVDLQPLELNPSILMFPVHLEQNGTAHTWFHLTQTKLIHFK